MFSGIVEEKGRVKSIISKGGCLSLTVSSQTISKDAEVGDSVSVNGVCLSATKVANKNLSFDVMEETVRKTNLCKLKVTSYVNLERSLKIGERISGHFVTGHIDCTGKIKAISRRRGDSIIDILLPGGKMVYLTEKGSVAVDGVSLTVGELKRNLMRLYLIPLTRESTTLGTRKTGDEVNIEFDIIGKYAIKTANYGKSEIDENFLKKHGFM
ncbi:MAG: riboflavin synthase [Candidatus Omnitrophica bacterium]|nr:riboflavin synthase [Candidatus Omnitrophota bacterium]